MGILVAYQNNSRKKINNLRKKLKTQDKNSRFRQSIKHCLPKTRLKKKPDLAGISGQGIFFFYFFLIAKRSSRSWTGCLVQRFRKSRGQ